MFAHILYYVANIIRLKLHIFAEAHSSYIAAFLKKLCSYNLSNFKWVTIWNASKHILFYKHNNLLFT